MVTIKQTTRKGYKVVYNLIYNNNTYLLHFYHDGDDDGWFVDCIAVNGIFLDECMQLFYEVGDTNLCNFEKLNVLTSLVYDLAVKEKLHIAVWE